MPFPGGMAASGSKAGSRYKFSIASTYAEFCPTLRDKLGEQSRLPEGVGCVMEIILNGRDLESIADGDAPRHRGGRRYAGIGAHLGGQLRRTLGKSFIYLHPHRQPS